MEFALTLVMAFIAPVLIDLAMKRGHFKWLESWFREAWLGLIFFLTIYVLSRPESRSVAIAMHGYLKDHRLAGYVMAAVVGAFIFVLYWGFTERFENPLSHIVTGSPAGESKDLSQHSPSTATENHGTTDKVDAKAEHHGTTDDIVAVKNAGASPATKMASRESSLKSESLKLAKDLSEWVALRSPDRPTLSVPILKGASPAEQAALYQAKVEFYQQAMAQFNSNVSAYYSEHFEDRVLKITSRLEAEKVFINDRNNDCRNPMFLEVFSMCADQIKAAALKLP